MSVKVVIKNGPGAPDTADLDVAELGMDTTNKELYMGDGSNPPIQLARQDYVDELVQGLDIKESVQAATTSNISGYSANTIPSASAPASVDDITLSTGDRILVKDQSLSVENGIYVVQANGDWERTWDLDTSVSSAEGSYVWVEDGSTNADMAYVISSGDVPGTDDLTWSLFSSAGILTAGDGLTKSDSTINVGAGGTGIAVNADNVALSHLGLESLTDPAADRIAFWDESKGASGAFEWLTAGSNLSIDGTTINATDTNTNQLTTWDIDTDDNSPETINHGEELTIAGGTNVVTSRVGTTVTINATDTNTNQLTEWNIDADSGGPATVGHNDTLDIAGGSHASTSLAGGILTINVSDDWYDSVADIPTAAPGDGDTTHLSTADQIYDWGIANFNNYSHPDYTETDVSVSGLNIITGLTIVNGHVNGSTSGAIPTATPSNGDTTHLSTADQIYDWATGQFNNYTDEMAQDAIGNNLGAGLAYDDPTGAVSLSHLGLESLTDPTADRIAFWDDGANAFGWLSVDSSLSLDGTTLGVATIDGGTWS